MTDWFEAVLGWEALKIRVRDTTHLTESELHVIAGLAIYLVATWLLRARWGDLRPLIPVVLAEAANETSDIVRYFHSGWPWTANGTISDVLLTIVPPLSIIVFVRAAREQAAARG